FPLRSRTPLVSARRWPKGSTATLPTTWSRRCWRKRARSRPIFWVLSTPSATAMARGSRMAWSPRHRDGRRPTAPGRRRAGTAPAAPAQGGGRELPHALNAACIEMWNSAAMAFGLGPLLTMAAVDALATHGSEELKRAYLPKLVSGEWMGTMQLTEPQAGSDVGALRTQAERAADG